ncbi:MAG TPA: YceI family protein [Gemmatimonadales bacterium]|nr:YceI family protein [Gemmatimonadales bacterium]
MPSLTTWQLDPAHTEVGFAVKHLMISTVRGRFADVRGTVQMDEADPTTGQVEVQIGVASIHTGNPQRDDHLRSADFFDVERFPTLSFRSRRVENGRHGDLRLIGDLTIRGVTREVPLEVTSEGIIQDPWGNRRAGFSGSLRIKRSDFGISWNQLIEAGGVAVGDEVRITLEAELVQEGVKQAA